MRVNGFVASKGVLLDDIDTPTFKGADTPDSDGWKRFKKWRESDPVALSAGMRREIGKLAGAKPAAGGFLVCCPFHADRTPSCTVTTEPGRRYFGQFRCYGCSARGNWFDFAAQANLDSLTGSEYQTEFAPKFVSTHYEEAFLGDSEQTTQPSRRTRKDPQKVAHSDAKRKLGLYSLEPPLTKQLGIHKEWRGIPTSLLIAIGAELEWWRHPDYPNMPPKWYLFLPVVVNEKTRGFTRAELVKPSGKRTAYVNKPGRGWVLRFGLFPFDYAIALMRAKGLRTIVLVEGQRDALRLIRKGIPAVAIMGTWSWSDRKIRLLEYAGVTRIVSLFDGDRAGKQATATIAPTLTTRFDTHVLRLWVAAEEMGLDKLDPFDMPNHLLSGLKKLVMQGRTKETL